MKQRIRSKPAGIADSEDTDRFSLAAQKLEAERPLRNVRLRRIASDLVSGRAGLAQEDLRNYLAGRPGDPDAINLMAHAELRLGHGLEALSLFTRCLDLAPDFALARFNYAKLLFQLNKFQDALKELDRLLA